MAQETGYFVVIRLITRENGEPRQRHDVYNVSAPSASEAKAVALRDFFSSMCGSPLTWQKIEEQYETYDSVKVVAVIAGDE